jgi:hypothetical protein
MKKIGWEKAKPYISPCDIKTSELFHENYSGHKIYRREMNFICTSGWDTNEGRTEIVSWLKVVANEQVRMYKRVKRSSEAALYHYRPPARYLIYAAARLREISRRP